MHIKEGKAMSLIVDGVYPYATVHILVVALLATSSLSSVDATSGHPPCENSSRRIVVDKLFQASLCQFCQMSALKM